ncbi:hypothetical protein H5154_07755 [Pseudoalteromonas sp. SR44-5]|uniref:hypothetical protein n=1 Tax=Pseudoalteromonas sp. SR44-5 TaxID=2760934 RepID=UPI001600A3A2|nr:hypothetical protein [Pseudoalteromonas sp. SR44-5]MBB1366289.1 hypothetical protein [Pseudoalteromonas sp. SR44-5]
MKKCNVIFSATMIAVFSVVAFANEPDLNSNPFLAEHAAQQQGAQVFSFTETPIELHEHDKVNAAQDTDYIRLAVETKTNGFALVDTSQIKDIDKVIAEQKYGHELFLHSLKPEIMAAQSTADQTNLSEQFAGDTVALDNILLQQEFTVMSKTVGGNFIAGSGWDQLTQIVKNDTFGTVIIKMFSFSQSSGVYIDADAVNYYVNSNPGVLYVLKDNSDNVYTSLSWADQKQSYSIGLEKNINDIGLEGRFKTLITSM